MESYIAIAIHRMGKGLSFAPVVVTKTFMWPIMLAIAGARKIVLGGGKL